MVPATVSTLIHEHMDDLTDAERRVARALLADYPAAGLDTTHALAGTAGVSAPTVVRFAASLGYSGFGDLQRQLRSELSLGAGSPVLRTLAQGTHRHHEPVAEAFRRRTAALEATLDLLPQAEVDAATSLIARCPGRVLVTGGFFSESVGRILALQLAQVRSDVAFLAEPLRRDAGEFLDAKRRSVMILFDLRRYEPAALEVATQAKQAGLDVVLVTDRWMSPVRGVADVVLPVEVEAVAFDTFVALVALVEVIVESVMTASGDRGLRRMKQWERRAVSHTRTAHDHGMQEVLTP